MLVFNISPVTVVPLVELLYHGKLFIMLLERLDMVSSETSMEFLCKLNSFLWTSVKLLKREAGGSYT